MTQRGEAWVQQTQSDLAVGRLRAEGVHAEGSNQAWQGAEAMGCRASMVRRRALPAPTFVGPVENCSRQADHGLGLTKRQISTSKVSPRPLGMGPKSIGRSPHRQIKAEAELWRSASGSRIDCPETP